MGLKNENQDLLKVQLMMLYFHLDLVSHKGKTVTGREKP